MSDERYAFEIWLESVHGLQGTWNSSRNCYDEFACHLAYCAYKHALDTVKGGDA